MDGNSDGKGIQVVVNGRSWRRTAVRWLPLLTWMGLIFILSDQTKTDIPSFGVWDLLVKKGAHFLAYGVLAVLALRAVGDVKRPYAIAFIIAVLYAASDEFHQTFVLGRNGQWLDVIIDSAGALTALMSHRWGILPLFPKPSP